MGSKLGSKVSDTKGRLARALVRLAGCLPLRWARRLGGAAGRLAVVLGANSLRVSRINLSLCYPALPAPEREALARRSLAQTLMTGFEAPSVWCQPWRRSASAVLRLRNRALLDEEVARGQGVLVLVPHLGNWELFVLYLATLAPLTALYAPPKLAALDQLIRRARESTGGKMMPADVRGVRALLQALRAGGVTVVLPDQDPDHSGGEFAPFFGHSVLTMTLPHNLLQRTGCRCLMGYGKRVPGGFELVFERPPEAIYSANTQQSLAAMNRAVEACIADAPEQYQWVYKRFRYGPEGETFLYQRA